MSADAQQRIDAFGKALRFAGGRARTVAGSYELASAIEEIVTAQGEERMLLYEPFALADDLGLGLALRARGLDPRTIGDCGGNAARLRVGLTGATLGIAESGSILVGGRPGGWGLATVLPWVHIAVLHAADLEPDLTAGFARLQREFRDGQRNWVWITGPSKTADIAKTLVMGIHGPNALEALIVTDAARQERPARPPRPAPPMRS